MIKDTVHKKSVVETLCQQALHFEIKSNGIFEVPQNIQQIYHLKTELPMLEITLLSICDQVILDVKDWRELDEKLKLMLNYVDSKDKDYLLLQNATSCEEIAHQLMELEVRVKDILVNPFLFSYYWYLRFTQCTQCMQCMQCTQCTQCTQCMQCMQCTQCMQCMRCMQSTQSTQSTQSMQSMQSTQCMQSTQSK